MYSYITLLKTERCIFTVFNKNSRIKSVIKCYKKKHTGGGTLEVYTREKVEGQKPLYHLT